MEHIMDMVMDMEKIWINIDEDNGTQREGFRLGCIIPPSQIVPHRQQQLVTNVQSSRGVSRDQRALPRPILLPVVGAVGRTTAIPPPSIPTTTTVAVGVVVVVGG